MKLTNNQLQQIIKEELEKVMSEMFAPSGQSRMDYVGNMEVLKKDLQDAVYDNNLSQDAADTILSAFESREVTRQTIANQIKIAMMDDPANAEIYQGMIIDNDLPEPQ